MRYPCCLGLLLMGLLPMAHAQPSNPHAQAAAPTVAFTLAWDWVSESAANPDGFAVRRCQVPAGQSTCIPTDPLPGMPIAGELRRYTDPTGTAGGTYCWTVVAGETVGVGQTSPTVSPPGTTSAGEPYLCKTLGGTLPPARATQLQQVGALLRISWTAPAFDATTVPRSALTGYVVWAYNSATNNEWKIMAEVGPTVLSWDYASPPTGQTCVQIGAQYGDLGRVDNDTVCADFAPVKTLPGPTNLREATR